MHIRREILRGPAGGPGAGGGSSAPGGSSDSDAGAVGAGGAAAGAPHESVAIAAASRPRSRCFINRSPVTLRSLRALSGLLLDMNGQHSSEALRDSDTQLALLDRVAGTGVCFEGGGGGGGLHHSTAISAVDCCVLLHWRCGSSILQHMYMQIRWSRTDLYSPEDGVH
jgi:hypothetical protein